MKEQEIRKLLEEVGVEQDKIDEIAAIFTPLMAKKNAPPKGSLDNAALLMLLASETDWKKRASLAARIISNDLLA